MKIPDLFTNFDMSEEGKRKRLLESYKNAQNNPENMSYWLPKIESSSTKSNSTLKIPETKIIPLELDWFEWLRSDRYTPEKIEEFNQYLVNKLGNFMEGNTLFMKTGIFSNKFTFSSTVVNNKNTIGEQFLDIFYVSMMVGADNSSEVVFREMVLDKENRLKIYDGMPLHTEFRVFYDFDSKEVLGLSNYWHPEVMEDNLKDSNAEIYAKEKEKIVSDFNQHKQQIASEVDAFMKGVQDLKGKWSVDVMKNKDEFWLIDMARMERSALVKQMEKL